MTRDVIRAGPIEVRFFLELAQTAGALTLFEFLVPAAARAPVVHSHEAFDETIWVGRAEFSADPVSLLADLIHELEGLT